ncbi:MAG TPA: PqqD family protein [Allosphingosinicella sp.]|nr:PqqD family protein [Allosphingosinicella sp.]
MDSHIVVKRCVGLLEAEVDGEIVGLHVDKGTCYGFNATATRVWSLIETPRTIAELRDALLEEYDVDPGVCEAELGDLLTELEADGLVELRREAGAG